MTDDRVAFERASGEPTKAFHAFTHFRNLAPGDRSIDKAWRDHQRRCQGRHQPDTKRGAVHWRQWSSTWGWIERAAAWDAAQDKVAREKIAKDQHDARVRHARMANAAMQALTVPSRATLEALQDPAVMARLIADAKESTRGFIKLIELVTWAGRVIPGLVAVERLALGMTTDEIVIDDRREETLGRRIAADATATDLAIALLDRLAGTSPGEQQP